MTTIELWDFQQKEVTRLEEQKSALFAWEMGTGKTVAAIDRDRRIRLREDTVHPTLVVAPLGTLDTTWKAHFEEMTDLKVRMIDPKARWNFLDVAADVYLVHFEALRLMPELQRFPWLHIIVDECQRVKNRNAKQTEALKKIPTLWKTALSGTPVINAPHEFWSILNWLWPKIWTSFWAFYKNYVDFEVEYGQNKQYHKIKGPKNEADLLRRISPYYSRVLKKDVMKDLPDKYWTKMWVTLGPKERRAYDQMNKEMIAWVGKHEDQPVVAPIAISMLMRLQQFALGYLEYVDGKLVMSEPSAKLDALMQLIEDNPDQQMVVFSQFKAPLTLLKRRLDAKGITYGSITGDDSPSERSRSIQGFSEGKCRLILGTIAAGGTGIDGLQRNCSTMVFLDRSWSPATNAQAEDRLHRGGQRNAVQIIDIMARNSVDQGKEQKLIHKWDMIRRMLGDKNQ